jgi:arsenite methyltransferase
VNELREQVRRRYAQAAMGIDSCCSVSDADGRERFGAGLYGDEAASMPGNMLATSLGCGNPTAMVELHPGETVLDLGSGAGLDVLLSAGRVGPAGTAYGLDMTDEMLAVARANAEAAGAANAIFLKGYMEEIPLPDRAVDVVISNCVINLSTDKPAVFAELARVLREQGRVAISDVVAEDRLTADERAARGSHVGCIAGALTFSEYHDALSTAGFTGISIESTHTVADGMHAAIIRAVR